MGDASKAAQDFVKEAKDGPVALGDLTKASKAIELAVYRLIYSIVLKVLR